MCSRPRNRCMTVQRTKATSPRMVSPMQYAMTRFGMTSSQECINNAIINAMTVLMASVIGRRRFRKSITVSSVPSNGENRSPSACMCAFIRFPGCARPESNALRFPVHAPDGRGRRRNFGFGDHKIIDGDDRERRQSEDQRQRQGGEAVERFHGHLPKRLVERGDTVNGGRGARGNCAKSTLRRRRRCRWVANGRPLRL